MTDSLATLVDCGAGTEAGFCSMSSSYPMDRVHDLMYSCHQVLDAWQAESRKEAQPDQAAAQVLDDEL